MQELLALFDEHWTHSSDPKDFDNPGTNPGTLSLIQID